MEMLVIASHVLHIIIMIIIKLLGEINVLQYALMVLMVIQGLINVLYVPILLIKGYAC